MPQANDFVHLHLHTEYSLLDGAISLKRLFPRLKELGMDSCAITDHGNMYGVLQFYREAKAAAIKPIIGVETYVAHGSRIDRTSRAQTGGPYHLILLAKDKAGYKNLCRMITLANLEGFYYHPRIDRALLEKYGQGLIGMSACLSGEIPTRILEGDIEQAVKTADYYRQVLGEDNFFLELQDNGLARQAKVNEGLLEVHRRTGIPLVATNDSHYLLAEEAKAHDILICIQTQKTVNDENRLKMETTDLYVKSPEEMQRSFSAWPEAIKNTRAIAERCNVNMNLGKFRFPRYDPPEGKTLDDHLYDMAKKGVLDRLDEEYPGLSQKDRREKEQQWLERLDYEMALIVDKGFSGYFLIVCDFISYARKIGVPVGPGRGSAAGSVLSYAIGITDINPIRWGLLFERFLNPERPDNPDIDIDFCAEGRDKIIDYVTEKYGKEHVAQISTFGTMKAKAVIRDVGRALGKTYAEVDPIAKLIPDELNMTLEKALKSEPRLLEMMHKESWVAELMEIARPLEGLNRHASTHAAGVVIGAKPLVEYLPLYQGKEGETVTQFDKDDVERAGLVKFDFLGLKTLTVIDKTLRLIKLVEKEEINLKKIPLDDGPTYELLQRGDSTGVFQFESSGMKDLLVKIHPTTFEDIIVMAALYRPGPLGSGMVDDFVDRKHGRQLVAYDLPMLEDILSETYGIMVYQEQVMQVARAVGGFSLGESDLLRKAMAKKQQSKMAKYRVLFLDGAKERKIDPKIAEDIFDRMAKFAEYGFNKSHSAAYAMVAYQTAWLKAHYPKQFMAALMSMDTNDSDRLMIRLQECRDMGIVVSTPDINKSLHDFNVADGKIIFGLAGVKNVGDGAIESILKAREKKSYLSIFDFCERVDLRQVNKRVLESLIKAGAFDGLSGHRAQVLAVADTAMEQAATLQKDINTGQGNMFETFESDLNIVNLKDKLPKVPEWEHMVKLNQEKEVLGFYLSGHPLEEHRELVDFFMTTSLDRLSDYASEATVNVAGIVTSLKLINSKRGQMAFVGLEDLMGTTELIVFSSVLDSCRELLESDQPIAVSGKVDAGEKGVKIIVSEILSIDKVLETWSKEVIFQLNAEKVNDSQLKDLKDIVLRYPGDCRCFFNVVLPDQNCARIAVNQSRGVRPTIEMMRDIRGLLGEDAILLR